MFCLVTAVRKFQYRLFIKWSLTNGDQWNGLKTCALKRIFVLSLQAVSGNKDLQHAVKSTALLISKDQ